MKKLLLSLGALVALTFETSAASITATNDSEASTDEPSAISDDAPVTVSGQIYFIEKADTDNVTGSKVAIPNPTLTLNDDANTVIQADDQGNYSFQWDRNAEVSFTVTCDYSYYSDTDSKQYYFYVPQAQYSLTPTADTKFDIQLIKTDNADHSPHMVRFHGTILSKAINDMTNGTVAIGNAIVAVRSDLENASTISYEVTTATDGNYDFVDDDGNPLLIGYLYYKVFVNDSKLKRYGSVINTNYYLEDAVVDGVVTANERERNYELVEYADMKVCVEDYSRTFGTSSTPGEAPYAPYIYFEFYDWDNNPVASTKAPINPFQLTSDYVEQIATGDYYGYYAHAKVKGYYHSLIYSNNAPGVQYIFVDNQDKLNITMQKENSVSHVLDPINKEKNPSHNIQLSFVGHNLKYNDTGEQIYLRYVGDIQHTSTEENSSNAPARYVTAESKANIPMYAEQGNNGTNDVINVFLDHDKGAPYGLLNYTNYELVMPEKTVVIDEYIYDWELDYDVPVVTGIFASDTEPVSLLVDIYTASGVLVKHSVEESSIHDLPSGLYIVCGATRAYKYLQR